MYNRTNTTTGQPSLARLAGIPTEPEIAPETLEATDSFAIPVEYDNLVSAYTYFDTIKETIGRTGLKDPDIYTAYQEMTDTYSKVVDGAVSDVIKTAKHTVAVNEQDTAKTENSLLGGSFEPIVFNDSLERAIEGDVFSSLGFSAEIAHEGLKTQAAIAPKARELMWAITFVMTVKAAPATQKARFRYMSQKQSFTVGDDNGFSRNGVKEIITPIVDSKNQTAFSKLAEDIEALSETEYKKGFLGSVASRALRETEDIKSFTDKPRKQALLALLAEATRTLSTQASIGSGMFGEKAIAASLLQDANYEDICEENKDILDNVVKELDEAIVNKAFVSGVVRRVLKTRAYHNLRTYIGSRSGQGDLASQEFVEEQDAYEEEVLSKLFVGDEKSVLIRTILLGEYEGLKEQGLTHKQVLVKLNRRYHPDKFGGGMGDTDDDEKRGKARAEAEEIYKQIGMFTNIMDKLENEQAIS